MGPWRKYGPFRQKFSKNYEISSDQRNIKITRTNSGELCTNRLSVILFLIAINDVSEIFDHGGNVKYLMYADDLAIYSSGEDINSTTHNVQIATNKLR